MQLLPPTRQLAQHAVRRTVGNLGVLVTQGGQAGSRRNALVASARLAADRDEHEAAARALEEQRRHVLGKRRPT